MWCDVLGHSVQNDGVILRWKVSQKTSYREPTGWEAYSHSTFCVTSFLLLSFQKYPISSVRCFVLCFSFVPVLTLYHDIAERFIFIRIEFGREIELPTKDDKAP